MGIPGEEGDGRSPTLPGIPDLHDALTDADQNADGSVHPGAIDPVVDGDWLAVDDSFVSNSLSPRDDR